MAEQSIVLFALCLLAFVAVSRGGPATPQYPDPPGLTQNQKKFRAQDPAEFVLDRMSALQFQKGVGAGGRKAALEQILKMPSSSAIGAVGAVDAVGAVGADDMKRTDDAARNEATVGTKGGDGSSGSGSGAANPQDSDAATPAHIAPKVSSEEAEKGAKTVIIIGSGPAGLYAAIQLADKFDVVVYDKYYTPNRARFLGLFSRERDLLARLGLDPEKITYFPEGKESKRGILSADLDMGLEMVARRRGVRFCQGYKADSLTGRNNKKFIAKRKDDNAAEPQDADGCLEPRSFKYLIWAAGSRNSGLPPKGKEDFPATHFGAGVISLDHFAMRGALFALDSQDGAIVDLLRKNKFDYEETKRLLESTLPTEADKIACLEHAVYSTAGEDAAELNGAVFDDVRAFSALSRDDPTKKADFVKEFPLIVAKDQPALSGSFFVSNLSPNAVRGYSPADRKKVAEAQEKKLPDWLFLNLGVHSQKDSAAFDVKRLHWEGPLPHKAYQEAKKAVSEALVPVLRGKVADVENEINRILTYCVMENLAVALSNELQAPAVSPDRLSWMEFITENPPQAKNAARSASIFESSFAASAATYGNLENLDTDATYYSPRSDGADIIEPNQEWFIVGDAAQDAWYRFGLGVHDAFSSVNAAVNLILKKPNAVVEFKDYRNRQALRALQIKHAVFAGQYAYENIDNYKDFATDWMNSVWSRGRYWQPEELDLTPAPEAKDQPPPQDAALGQKVGQKDRQENPQAVHEHGQESLSPRDARDGREDGQDGQVAQAPPSAKEEEAAGFLRATNGREDGQEDSRQGPSLATVAEHHFSVKIKPHLENAMAATKAVTQP